MSKIQGATGTADVYCTGGWVSVDIKTSPKSGMDSGQLTLEAEDAERLICELKIAIRQSRKWKPGDE